MYVHVIMNARPVLLVASLTAFAGYCLIFLIKCCNLVRLFLSFIVVFGMLIKQWFCLRDMRYSYEHFHIGNISSHDYQSVLFITLFITVYET